MKPIALKRLATINAGTLPALPREWETIEYADLAAGDVTTGNFLFRRISRDEAPTRARRILVRGDVLVSSLVDGRKAQPVYAVPDPNGGTAPRVFSTGFFSARAHADVVEPRFLYYVLSAIHVQAQLQAAANGVTMVAFTPEDLGSTRFVLPDLSRQREIAELLDVETSRIDRLLQRKRRIIELLRERVWVAFADDVARSSAQDVPLRRAFMSITDGPFGSAFTSADYSADGAAVVRLGNIGFAEYRDDDQAFIPLDLYRSFLRYRVSAGDLLIAGLGDAANHAGRACVAPDLGAAIVKGKCFCARVNGDVASSEYLALLLSSQIGADAVGAASRGSTRSMINLDIVKSTVVPLPTVDAQQAIVSNALSHRRQVQSAIDVLNRQTLLLEEHRRALISAVVADVARVPVRTP